ncbi:alpha/beta hydrolase [Polymorphobacter fuscus]|uniref:Alpha/beta fold hydrolase n=1 Tax=Sandarakinorhabdus fusca TaxID=1439888 RepID=A0A7C9KJB7_9SPHN|nr:alpha/beta hydrolase [Polymorphobacter fuscus]KAB7645489.1 alpha/beta hydrolase [Polymorphobacter fuscus]MQT17921.1 alpha/beta fold hydrolase [Polymorphobacter fuscus]NJC08551.1 pimeloyl-ACP methyl ester carboxylesterase [Polymorphobacter fuscus]
MTMMQMMDHQGVQLAFRHVAGAGPLLVFLPGYMSDMTGSKAQALADWATAAGRASLRLDYSGCGASGGDFLDGSIGRWTGDAAAVIDHVAPGLPVVLVGSSMGGWVALRLGERLRHRLAGLVGVAAAPDFTDWGLDMTDADRAALAAQGWFARPSDYDGDGYRYSRALIADAPTQRVLGGAIAIDAPVTLLHGQRDDAVPWRLSLDIAERLRSDRVKVTLVKDGDHRLSRPQDIALLIAAVAEMTGETA